MGLIQWGVWQELGVGKGSGWVLVPGLLSGFSGRLVSSSCNQSLCQGILSNMTFSLLESAICPLFLVPSGLPPTHTHTHSHIQNHQLQDTVLSLGASPIPLCLWFPFPIYPYPANKHTSSSCVVTPGSIFWDTGRAPRNVWGVQWSGKDVKGKVIQDRPKTAGIQSFSSLPVASAGIILPKRWPLGRLTFHSLSVFPSLRVYTVRRHGCALEFCLYNTLEGRPSSGQLEIVHGTQRSTSFRPCQPLPPHPLPQFYSFPSHTLLVFYPWPFRERDKSGKRKKQWLTLASSSGVYSGFKAVLPQFCSCHFLVHCSLLR